jgi:hypothetical protein
MVVLYLDTEAEIIYVHHELDWEYGNTA